MNKDSIQYYELKVIIETVYLQTKSTWLMVLQDSQSLNANIAATQNQLMELFSKREQLQIEKEDYNQQLQVDFMTSYNELQNQLEQWKLKYTFTAVYDGKLEMLNFWKEDEFIQAGRELFSVIPDQNPVEAHVLLPSQGAGKVKEGQEVIIKLDNYPYLEYGSVTGRVKSISLLSNLADKEMAQQNISTYLVNVELPNQLTTNYGTNLNFGYEIKGMAEILTKKRRLLERLFDNLKYINKQN